MFFCIFYRFLFSLLYEKHNMSKNTNDGKYWRSLLFASKLFYVFLFFLVKTFQAQIFISGGASVYGEKEVLVLKPDSLAVSSPKSKIYISLGVKISNLESSENYEIVEILPSKNIKPEPKKQSVLHIAQKQSAKKVQEKIAPKKDNPSFYKLTFSTSKLEKRFTFIGKISTFTEHFQPTYAKQINRSEGYKTSFSFREIKLASEHFKRAEILTFQNKSAFPVRPPPFLS